MYISPIAIRTLLAQFSSSQPFRTTYQYNRNSATYTPDGIQNWLLRKPRRTSPGRTEYERSADDRSEQSGGDRTRRVRRDDGRSAQHEIHEWNVTLEKQIRSSMVFRLRYTGRHGYHADQLDNINPQPSNYVWYVTTGTALPPERFRESAAAIRSESLHGPSDAEKTGFINTQTFVVEFERRFNRGLAFQAFHTVTNATGWPAIPSGTASGPCRSLLPGAVPTDSAALNRFLNFQRDTSIPHHRTRWNWTSICRSGKVKMLARNAPTG